MSKPQDLTVKPRSNPKPKPESFEYTLLDTVLGSGAFSEVLLAQNTQSQQMLAVKVTDLKKNCEYYEREIAALSEIPVHRNIVQLVQYGEDGEKGYMFMMYEEGEVMSKVIEKEGRFGEGEALEILEQLVMAMEVIHDAGFSHNDIKPDNILYLSDKKIAKIIDFGLSTQVDEDGTITDCCGSPSFMAPEVISQWNCHNAYAADIWSLGVVFYSMLVGDLPWPNCETIPELKKHILSGRIGLPIPLSKGSCQLLQGMLQLNPKSRWNLKKIKEQIETIQANVKKPKLTVVTKYSLP